ncbi:DUF6453 family protein [Leminorella grimontii]|uniref:DUF6453 family protein n=1 Tax=Leminorella grimontii TaxID=82981 RepID=UPI00040E52FC|nr:DUF6453 family protein [Leminorella grimontii]KFC95699.1 phage protein [Leminorella grimontii ATCC 33999 = DSM 5078]VFS60017.1 Uncharacterised protein [Leminorella grimontii]
MSYGISITPEVTNKPMDITSGSRAMSYLGRYSVQGFNNSSKSNAITVSGRTPGSTLCVVPLTVTYVIDSGTYVDVDVVNNIWFSGDSIYFSTSMGYGLTRVDVAVFEVLGVSNATAKYGISLASATDYMEITSNSKVGCCVWTGTVTINQSWSVPTTVPGWDNAVVFVNWDDAGATLTYDDASKTIRCWRHSGGVASNIYPSSVTANIAVFSSGFTLSPPAYGLAIYNATGACTFSSRYAPMMLSEIVTLPDVANSWVGCQSSKPMVPISQTGGAVFSESGWQIWNHCGVKMSGNAVCGGAANRLTRSAVIRPVKSSYIARTPLPVIDGNLYF